MKNTTAGGGGDWGVILAIIMLILGVAVFVSIVGFTKAVYLLKHAF